MPDRRLIRPTNPAGYDHCVADLSEIVLGHFNTRADDANPVRQEHLDTLENAALEFFVQFGKFGYPDRSVLVRERKRPGGCDYPVGIVNALGVQNIAGKIYLDVADGGKRPFWSKIANFVSQDQRVLSPKRTSRQHDQDQNLHRNPYAHATRPPGKAGRPGKPRTQSVVAATPPGQPGYLPVHQEIEPDSRE